LTRTQKKHKTNDEKMDKKASPHREQKVENAGIDSMTTDDKSEPRKETNWVSRTIAQIDFLLPPTLRQADPETLRRSRLIAAFSFSFSLISLLILPISMESKTFSIRLLLTLAILFHTCNLGLMWLTNSHKVSSILFVLGTSIITGYVTYLTGGLYSPSASWHLLLPLIALFLLGKRWGTICFVLLLLQMSFFYLVHSEPQRTIYQLLASHPFSYLISSLSLFSFSFFLVWFYDSSRARAWKELKSSLAQNQSIQEERDKEKHANEAKSAFLANMSHELRTPLNAVLGYTELIEEELPEFNAESLQPDIDKIKSASHHLLSLINDILDLSKIEAGKMELFPNNFSMQALLRETIDISTPLVQNNHNTVIEQWDDSLGSIEADQRRLQQCLYNLLSNAAKFTSDGTITVAAKRQEQKNGAIIHIGIIDTGIGMDEAMLAKLFEKFTQEDHSSTRKYGGTGLGLAITKELCRLMGAELAVHSIKGEGTTFALSIPTTPPSWARYSNPNEEIEGPTETRW
jgi:signal transduction histidine kinase